MALALRTTGLLRALIYPATSEKDPKDGIDKVLDEIVAKGALESTPKECLDVIRESLASEESLSGVLPQDHPEVVIREFLTELAARIQKRWM